MRVAAHRRFWLRRLWWLAALLVYALLPFAPAPAPVAADSLVRAEAAERAQPLLAPANVAAQQAAAVPLKTVWNSPQPDRSYSAAWGDLDNDGDLDLALGNYDAPNQVYRNCFFRQVNDGCAPGDQLLSGQPAWTAPMTTSTQSLAWGDVDNDGDLDLAVGNRNAANQLYRNDGGTLLLDSAWTPNKGETRTYSLAWGDVDGDLDLDLAVGNRSQVSLQYKNQLYRNCLKTQPGDGCTPGSGGLASTPFWTAPEFMPTTSLAWGDVDNDGDLDLAVGNDGAPNQVYRNCRVQQTPDNGCAGQIFSVNIWAAPDSRATSSLAWGDLGNDGDLDLAVGNATAPNQIYVNQDGVLGTPQELSQGISHTYSVAWGDANGDGQPDLAVGKRDFFARNELYLGSGDTLTRDPNWLPAPSFTSSIAWGDADNDGLLDLAVANACVTEQPSDCYQTQLYRNQSAGLATVPDDVAGRAGLSSLAWGDFDNDGDLDLAGGWYETQGGAPFQLFRNSGGVLTAEALVGGDSPMTRTLSLAWGDFDNDGDLDLAVGSREQPTQLYRNDGGSFALAQALADGGRGTTSLAWGDVDGDGDLDLAVGNDCTISSQFRCYGNQLFRNSAGTLVADPLWSPEPVRSTSLAWGDVDGDGDLDLAVGNRDRPNQLYRNDKGALPATPEPFAPIASGTRSLAWGDVDGDGDLDLAVGNFNNANQLYRNTNGQLAIDRSWAPEPTTTYRVAWGDVDGDGDLDLATANDDEPHQLYRNQKGQLQLDQAWSPLSDGSFDLAWGDVDSDGDLDLVVANSGNQNDNIVTIYNNKRNVPQRKGATPSVRVLRPTPPADGGFGSAPRIFDQPTLTFTYTLRHPSAWPVQRVIGQYSLDGGGCWRPAVEVGAIMTGTQGLAIDSCVAAIPAPTAPLSATLPTSSDGISYNFTWDLFASGVFGQSDNVLFRLIAIPAVVAPDGLPGPLRHTASTATTNPFRVRGTQVQIRTATGPAADVLVFRLPRGQSSGAQPFADATGRLLRSDLQGVLPGRGTLALGDQLTALVPISATETYTLYHTNATPTLTGTEAFTVRQPGVQTLDVSADNPLLLLNLVVSLEWDASQEPQFLAQLDNDLRRASELLFDWSDGQVALGELTLYQAKQQWDDAHIRIYATNRMRPNAVKGGIVSETSTDPITQTVTYGPGQVRIGAVWNRYGDPAGALGEDWPRTLAHELGHYALFLDDNYLGLDDQGLLVPVTICAGTAMADPYRDDYSEFHPDAGWLPACAKTLSQQETGRSDWVTINSFYPALHTPDERASGPNPGPNLLPLAVTRVRIVDPPAGVQRAPLAAPIFLLAREDGSRYPPSEGARAFLFRRDEPHGAAVDIVDLGRPTLDQVLARGARPGDRVCVFDLGARRPDGTNRVAEPRLGCEEQVSPSDQQLTLARVDWQPDLSVTPVTSTTLAVRVGNLPAGLTLTARLYPSFGSTTAPGLTQPLQPAEPGVYRGSFTLDGPAFAGYLHLWVENEQPRRELVSGLTLIGSPGAGWGRGAPRGNPGAAWGRGAPVVSSDGQVLLYSKETAFATDQAITIQATDSAPSPLSWATLIGQAYRVASSAPALAGVSISFSYLGREVPDGEESGLRVYRWDALGQRWEVLPTALNLAQNNASALLDGPGLYALMSSIVLPIEHAGWNLVAYPAPDQPMPAALGSIAGFYTTVYGYDAGNPTDPWQVYDAGVPPEWAPLVNDLRTLRYGQGYWINATQPITALLQGRPATIVLNTTSGISSPPATYYGLAPAGVPAGTAVSARMGGTLCGETRTDTLTLDGQERVVFVIHVRSAGEGEDAGCGTPGRVIALVFGAGTATGGRLSAHWDNSRVHRLFEGAGRLYLPMVRR